MGRGRKLVLAPDGLRIDNAMIKTIARAFCWQKLMENGKHTHHGRGDCRQARAPANATGARVVEALLDGALALADHRA